MKIRLAEIGDLSRINDIYNTFVEKSTATFDTQPTSIEQREEWFAQHGGIYPVLVAEEKEVMGWGSLSPFSQRPAYRFTVEHSIYVAEEYQRQGIGTRLLEELMARAIEGGFHTMVARITGENQASVNLHKKYGFEQVGLLKEVGYKFGRWLDVIYMQKILSRG
ncbi:MAG: N-acetyltransferase [Firmicutes bacterium]|nr:N-acetyltransferase [Bacillota bacterium]